MQEYLACVVSDGAGSAQNGGVGAELACTIAIKCIEASIGESKHRAPERSDVEAWIENIQQAIRKEACAAQLKPRDYACTLLAAVLSPSWSLFFQIGDGAIVAAVRDVQGVVFWPDSGLYANMTYFVTDEDALEHLQTASMISNIDEVALFSDGLQRLALTFEHQVPHAPFFDPMLKVLRTCSPSSCDALEGPLIQFLNSPRVNARTDDDKTLVLATRR